jgi:titin
MRKLIAWALLLTGLAGCDSTTSTSFNTPTATATPTTARVQLNWTTSAPTAQGYYVEQSNDGVNFTQVLAIAAPPVTLSGLTKGAQYSFRVRAFNAAGDSPYTAVTTVTIPSN